MSLLLIPFDLQILRVFLISSFENLPFVTFVFIPLAFVFQVTKFSLILSFTHRVFFFTLTLIFFDLLTF